VNTDTLKAVDSAVQEDFNALLSAFATNVDPSSGIAIPYVLRGFSIVHTGVIGNPASALAMIVANAGIFQGASVTSGTFYLTEFDAPNEVLDGNLNSGVVTGTFAAGTTNYIGIDYSRTLDPTTEDIVYFYDVASDSQFSRVVPLARTLNFVITISTLPFTDPAQARICPIAQVVTDVNNSVVSITDSRPLMFGLGEGGQTPDLSYTYPWSQGRAPNGTTENSSNSSTNVFVGGDKSIGSLKELINAMLSAIKEIKGTAYWSSASGGGGGGGSVVHLREDAVNTVVTGTGSVTHGGASLVVTGQMNWDSAINLKVVGSALTYKILANNATTDITLAANEVAYLNLVRDEPVSSNLIWTNGSTVVTSVGAASWTSLLLAGDFIRIAVLGDDAYYEIAAVNSISQVTLTAAFSGATSPATGDASFYAFGTYQTNAAPSTDRHVQVALRGSVPSDSSTYWLFLRSDTSVYARFFGEELVLGESQEIGEGISNQNLAYMGATSPADSTPEYSIQSPMDPTTGNSFVENDGSLTRAIKTLDTEANSPLRPRANVGAADQSLYFESSSVLGADGTDKTVGPIQGSVWYNIPTSSINFALAQPVGVAPSDFEIGAITPTNTFYYVASFSLNGEGKIEVLFSDAEAALITLQDPAVIGALFPKTNSPIGYVFLQYFSATQWRTASSASPLIENADIVRFGSGAGGGAVSSGTGSNDDLISMLFRGKITDAFEESSALAISTINPAVTQTTADYVAPFEIYQISYDASKTIAVGTTATDLTLSSAPAFTVVVGDMAIWSGQARRITTVTSQTAFNVDAFNSIPAFNDQVTVSQVISTKELYGYAGNGVSLSTTFVAATFSEFLIDYEDSSVVNDNIFDIASAPVVAWVASGDNLTWTDLGLRPTLQTTTAQPAFLSVASAAFYVKFFANQTALSGSVNLINYRAYMQKDPTSAYGAQNSSIGLTDSSLPAVNCTISVVGGLTRVVLPYQYAVNVATGMPYGSLDVYLNGQILPRFIAGTTATSFYTEVNATTIDLNQNYSALSLEIEVLQRVTVVDTSTTNTTDIAINTADIYELQVQQYINNAIVNGAFNLFSNSSTLTFTNSSPVQNAWVADMWATRSLGTTNREYTLVTNTSVPTFGQSGYSSNNSLRVISNSAHANAAGDFIEPYIYNIEGYDYQRLHGGVVTFGFWVQSTIVGSYSFALQNAAANRSYVTTFTIASANTWEFQSITVFLGSSGTWDLANGIGLRISIGAGTGSTFQTATLGAWQVGDFRMATGSTNLFSTNNASMYLAQVSLEKSAIGLPSSGFVPYGNSGVERAVVDRYYQNSYSIGTALGTSTSVGSRSFRNQTTTGATQIYTQQLAAKMRSLPTITLYALDGSAGFILDATNLVNRAADAIDISTTSFTVNVTGSMASNSMNRWQWLADARLF